MGSHPWRGYLKSGTFNQFKNAKSSSQLMAVLPKERLISGEHAFHATGCVFFWPDNHDRVLIEDKVLGVYIRMFRHEGNAFVGMLQLNL